MGKSGWSATSIGRKFIMALSGFFLITFIIVHLLINSFTLFDAELFNEASHFMATNPVIKIMQYVLALGFIIHIGMGIRLTLQNNAARPVKYAYNKPGESSSFSSRSMIITGLLVLVFIVLHLKDYFWVMKFDETLGGYSSDYALVVGLFSMWQYTLIYVVSFIFLGFHLNHGFQSAFQSMGVNHKKYTPIIKSLSTVFCVVVAVGFSAIALVHFFNA